MPLLNQMVDFRFRGFFRILAKMKPVKTAKKDLLLSLQVLNQIGAAILSEQTTEQMIETVYHHVNQLMDAYSFAIGIYNPVSKRIDYIGARENDRKLPAFSVNAHSTDRFSGWVFIHKKTILIGDYEAEYEQYLPKSITPLQGIEPASLMYVPILIQQEIGGLLSVRTMAKNAYDEHSLEVLKTLAVFIGKAIENRLKTTSMSPELLPDCYLVNPLSARELEVLNLLAKGHPNKAIAAELFISDSTVKTHTLNIYQKLEAANRTEAIAKARRYSLIV